MPQFYVPRESIINNNVIIDGEEAHHLIKSLRINTGQTIRIFTGHEKFYFCKITGIEKKKVVCEITEELIPKKSKIYLRLYQSLVKFNRFENLLEKAGEIGVDEIIPIITHRALIKINQEEYERLLLRWQKIVLSAIKQCDSFVLTKISGKPLMFEQAIKQVHGDELNLMCYENESANSLKDSLTGLKKDKVNLFIGPEGGFEQYEVDMALARGIKPVSIGINILRSETAGIIASGIVKC